MANSIYFERTVANIEWNLSNGALIPILGSIAGMGKVIFGIIQTVGSLLAMIFSLPFIYNRNGRDIFCRSGALFINGLANIVAGALEAIPFVGSAIAIARCMRKNTGSDLIQKICTGQEHMFFVGYRILEDNPSHILNNEDNKTLDDFIREGANLRSFERTSPLISL